MSQQLIEPHDYTSNGLLRYDPNCKVCGGKHRDSIHTNRRYKTQDGNWETCTANEWDSLLSCNQEIMFIPDTASYELVRKIGSK